MATTQPKSGVSEYTITGGTGPVTLTGPVQGYRGWGSSDDGDVFHYSIRQQGTTFEVGIGTYTHSSRQISRTTVLGNINGTTSPLSLSTGSTKEVSIVLPGERTAMLDCVGEWLEDQHFNGKRLYLDAAQTSWIDMASSGVFKLFIASVLVWQSSGGSGNATLIGSNDTAVEGPELSLQRDSATPAANDALGFLSLKGKDAGGTTQVVGKIRAAWNTVTAGSHGGMLSFYIANSGALVETLRLQPGLVSVPSTNFLITAGKTSSSLTVAGTELHPNGKALIISTDGSTPLELGRAAGDGVFIGLYSGGVLQATVFNTGITVTWGAFTANHYGDFPPDVSLEHDKFGTVLACTGKLLATTPDPFYELRPAASGDRRVLGVHGGRQLTTIMGGDERSLIVLLAVGNGWVRATGPIAAGDLLWASDIPGVAERQANQDAGGPWTVAKATNDSPDDGGERLVSCIYMAG